MRYSIYWASLNRTKHVAIFDYYSKFLHIGWSAKVTSMCKPLAGPKSKSTLNIHVAHTRNKWMARLPRANYEWVKLCASVDERHMAAGSIGQKQTFSPQGDANWRWRICRINQLFGVAQCRTTTKWIYSIFGMRSNINLETLTIFRPLHPNARIVQ